MSLYMSGALEPMLKICPQFKNSADISMFPSKCPLILSCAYWKYLGSLVFNQQHDCDLLLTTVRDSVDKVCSSRKLWSISTGISQELDPKPWSFTPALRYHSAILLPSGIIRQTPVFRCCNRLQLIKTNFSCGLMSISCDSHILSSHQ